MFGFDTGVIGGVMVMDGFRDTMGLPRLPSSGDDTITTAETLGTVVALLSVGASVGAPVGGPFADKVGRKKTTVVGAVLATVGR